jgi:Ran-binding protein 9/10
MDQSNNTANISCVSSSSNSSSSGTTVFVGDIFSRLYPNVNQQEVLLPRQWSSIHKCQSLSLTNGNLRITYKGPGKNHKDAASVRTDHPIPPICGIYYYEIKIISKGRDGYMGIGLSKADVNLNRLPGI